uniref:ATM n=1 Tax=Pavo cristatus TaxID=9049 RepID=A0A8C9FJS6_PAVCR
MNLALHDLFMCCRRLENERATERRNEIENFKRLLCDPEIVLQLDRSSDSRRGNQLNWDAVFRRKKVLEVLQSVECCMRSSEESVEAKHKNAVFAWCCALELV